MGDKTLQTKHRQSRPNPLHKAFELGYKSFYSGHLNNPFAEDAQGFMLHREWQRGFNSAYFTNQKEIAKHGTEVIA